MDKFDEIINQYIDKEDENTVDVEDDVLEEEIIVFSDDLESFLYILSKMFGNEEDD